MPQGFRDIGGRDVAIENVTYFELASSNDGTKTSLIPPTGDYLLIGDAGTTSHTLNANDDLMVSGELEVDGTTFLDADLTQTVGDYTLYEDANNSDPSWSLGTSAAESFTLQTVCNSSAKTLDYVLFKTVEAGSTADKGQYKFQVDSSEILRIDDGGLELTGGINASSTIAMTGGDITLYDDNNNSDPYLAMGTSATESLKILTTCASTSKTLQQVEFITATADGTADYGKYIFDVDGTDILTIDDGGLELTGAIAATTGAAEGLRLSTNADDYIKFTMDANGGCAIESVDTAAAAANISITADGTFAVSSTAFNVSSAGAVSGVTTLATSDAVTLGTSSELVCTPLADQARANDSAITVGAVNLRVAGDGAATVLDADPAIADGTADGQIIIIKGTSDTNTVTIADGCNTRMAGGQDFVVGLGDTIMFVWDSGDSLWDEIHRSNN